ncbi:MAG TPA: phosphoribosylanthranilate isomerase [Anaerolineales bacterium]
MTRIKICGIKTLPDALAAMEAGADMLGFNFYPKSPRFIEIDRCAGITGALRHSDPSVLLVGVFVNASVEDIERALKTCNLDLAQLSGDESPELCAALKSRAFKAFHGIADHSVQPYVRTDAPAFLVDAAAKGAYGGTGRAADWSSAARLARQYPILLAGGLKPDNVAEAVDRVRPWGVDVASGVEAEPGRKDAARMKAFVNAVHSMELESS